VPSADPVEPLPAELAPVPSVLELPEDGVPELLAPVPSVELALPLPAVLPPVPSVVLVCANAAEVAAVMISAMRQERRVVLRRMEFLL
jgi:hypothetical protein